MAPNDAIDLVLFYTDVHRMHKSTESVKGVDVYVSMM